MEDVRRGDLTKVRLIEAKMLILQQGRISSSTQGERNPRFGFCQSSISCTRQCDSVGIILSVSDQSVCIPPRTLPTTPFPIHHHPSTSPLQINHNPPRRIPRLILSIHNTRIHRQRRLPLPEPLPHPPLPNPRIRILNPFHLKRPMHRLILPPRSPIPLHRLSLLLPRRLLFLNLPIHNLNPAPLMNMPETMNHRSHTLHRPQKMRTPDISSHA